MPLNKENSTTGVVQAVLTNLELTHRVQGEGEGSTQSVSRQVMVISALSTTRRSFVTYGAMKNHRRRTDSCTCAILYKARRHSSVVRMKRELTASISLSQAFLYKAHTI